MSLSADDAHDTPWRADGALLFAIAALLGLGLVMVASASIGFAERTTGDAWFYARRQAVFALLALALLLPLWRVPLDVWQRWRVPLLLGALLLLGLVLVPGVGRVVNGSARWISLGPLQLQVSEAAKLAMVIYTAGFLAQHREQLHTLGASLRLLGVLGVTGLLLLLEPDFGATAVIAGTVLGMMFLAGMPLWLFAVISTGMGALLAGVAVLEPYRLTRLTSFMNPWDDPFRTDFQLSQALIAFGRGEWLGSGLGASIQKLHYLPEAHNDFLFAVLGEELGLLGVLSVILLFMLLLRATFRVAARSLLAGRSFGGFLAYGVGLWFCLQALVHMGVNLGALPTKGITLPLMSYGGSSLLITGITLALLLRADRESWLALPQLPVAAAPLPRPALAAVRQPALPQASGVYALKALRP
jgi:cell division protein FtsW